MKSKSFGRDVSAFGLESQYPFLLSGYTAIPLGLNNGLENWDKASCFFMVPDAPWKEKYSGVGVFLS